MSSLLNKLTLLLLLILSVTAHAYPLENGDRARYDFSIELKKSNITGIMVMMKEDDVVKGSLVNEFGVSALDFSYQNGKIKIESMLAKIDKWYIRALLRKDLVKVMDAMKNQEKEYLNKRRGIRYRFIPLTAK